MPERVEATPDGQVMHFRRRRRAGPGGHAPAPAVARAGTLSRQPQRQRGARILDAPPAVRGHLMDSVLRGAAVYAVLLVIGSVSGCRTAAKMQPFDFVLRLIIHETPQTALMGEHYSINT